MNIFWLDTDLEKCARYHVDKHVVKMPTEYAQMLCDTALHAGYTAPMKPLSPAHHNHPCTKWVRVANGNYTLLYDLAVEVGKEYTYRYGKVHKSTQHLEHIPRVLYPEEVTTTTPLPNCTSFKGYFPSLNLVDLYRLFYLRDKTHILNWKFREKPPFMGERFYRQQLEAIGDCPGNPKSKERKPTKDDYVDQLGTDAVRALLMTDLQKLTLSKNKFTGAMPSGRLKAPYIEACKTIHSEVDWSKLTVANLKAVLDTFK